MVTLHLTHSDLHLASRASAAGLIGRRGNPGLICVTAASHLRPPQVPQLHPLRPGFAFNYLPSRVKTQLKITINHKRMNSLWSPDCINTKHAELFGRSSTWFELCRSHIASSHCSQLFLLFTWPHCSQQEHRRCLKSCRVSHNGLSWLTKSFTVSYREKVLHSAARWIHHRSQKSLLKYDYEMSCNLSLEVTCVLWKLSGKEKSEMQPGRENKS